MKWQDISTAPKDGTEILIREKGAFKLNQFAVASYFEESWHVKPTRDMRLCAKPTHWMPLPEGPEEE